jgi:hypothetical protein
MKTEAVFVGTAFSAPDPTRAGVPLGPDAPVLALKPEQDRTHCAVTSDFPLQ